MEEKERLITSLQIIDPLISFLTKASGRTLIPLSSLRSIIPKDKHDVIKDIPHLVRAGVLYVDGVTKDDQNFLKDIFDNDFDDSDSNVVMIGFPPITNHFVPNTNTDKKQIKGGLHGSTKAAGKRRLVALKRSFNDKPCKVINSVEKLKESDESNSSNNHQIDIDEQSSSIHGMVHNSKFAHYSVKEQHERIKEGIEQHTYDDPIGNSSEEGKKALENLYHLFDKNWTKNHSISKDQSTSDSSKSRHISKHNFILPQQAAYAGSQKERPLRNSFLSNEKVKMIPTVLANAMGLKLSHESMCCDKNQRQLYFHQAKAIESALEAVHTLVCTGTGSGKTLCFLLPILATIMNTDMEDKGTCALIMFPTKALAQDQLSKLQSLLKMNPLLGKHIRPGIIDGDTPHQNRKAIANSCNIILSNPDTLHAAILPGCKSTYQNLLSKLQYVVIDELHSYEGAFGAHVSLVLSRLARVCQVANVNVNANPNMMNKLVFLGCSATIGHPEDHFRLICPISKQEKVNIVTAEDDGSKCAAKYFFVWNPSLLDSTGNCIGQVTMTSRKSSDRSSLSLAQNGKKKRKHERIIHSVVQENSTSSDNMDQTITETTGMIKRNHAADETARILAHLVKSGVRSIAFCKTRSLAEWVYERCVALLRSSSEDRVSMVDIYRGGYSASIRRGIEGRLFRNELFGVVGTCALELGVDIGGIDVTLHCGYPGSLSSVLQQAGRAGRGNANGPSYAIMVCFSSPSEQHLWKNPKGLLGRGLSSPPAIPLNAGIVSGHMLCAADEFPLVGKYPVTSILYSEETIFGSSLSSDHDLFGSEETYIEALESLIDRGCVTMQKHNILADVETYSIHPSMKNPWAKVSLRSIEPINYSIVDTSHPKQDGTDIICEEAVLDCIPYSRVFYHAYPGAIIIHRGKRYKIHSMSSPPAFANTSIGYRYNVSNLGAFAHPTNVQYSTSALSTSLITVVKQLHRVELPVFSRTVFVPELTSGCLAGNGVVTVKRTVHGYKRISLVNRVELSRSEISLPPMEYDTNGLWIDTEAHVLKELIPDYDKGVHALSHAIVAVAPLFVPCNSSDLDCDHSHISCSKVLLFDVRAGGAGTCALLWRYFFHPDGVLKAAIDLLSECPLECDVGNYKGGCPGCIQAVPCINFQQDLSRRAALFIAQRMLARIERTTLYNQNCTSVEQQQTISPTSKSGTPRRQLREKRLKQAADLVSARNRSIIVGRQSWPTDNASARFNDIDMENIDSSTLNSPHSPGGGGFVK